MDIWGMSVDEWRKIHKSFKDPCPRQNIGDVTVVCHSSNQEHFIESMIATARSITDKIIIFDDCSQDDTRQIAFDNGCRVFDVPEGWIYTHGFGALITRQVEVCDTQYHLQLDTGERLWIPPDCPKITGGYSWVLRLNMPAKEPSRFIQKMYYRLINTSVDMQFTACIHGSPRDPSNIEGGLTESQIAIFHGNPEHKEDNTAHYLHRKNRLYWKVLKKGYYEKTLENTFWMNEYISKKENYDKQIVSVENIIGALEETTEDIQEVFQE